MRHDPFLGRQGENHPQRNIGNLGERNDRQLQHKREPGTGGFPRAELSEVRQRVNDAGRNRSHGRREMYLAA
ncbi:hypothetical protein BGU48_03300 [Clostridioides difficile]|nr:hypothetical protein BGU19_00435 [Clostridioides difficile]PBF42628.1 hypothetical protein BGU48_03300 [Clostridioides difficile]PBH24956.1 hypothetical protein BGV20_00465 [Clostridioides difficile]